MANLLLLSYAFQPDNTPAAARPSQLFRYLPEFGVATEVLASSVDGGVNRETAVRRVPGTHEAPALTAASLAARAFMRFAAPYNDRLPWVPFAAAAASRLIQTRKIDAIYSTSPFLASHFAALWLKRKFGLPWIADFQDPICDNPFRSRKWFYPYDPIIEREIFTRADRVIANTDAIADVWKARYPARAHAISVLWNSFDPDETVERAPAAAARTPRVLAHIGTLYGGRHPGQLLGSLKRLGIGAEALRVKLIGPIDEAVLAAHGAAFAAMGDVVEAANTLVPRETALRETAAADCLLLLDVNERNTGFQVPSKLLDYIRIGKPILAYTPAASPVDRILEKSGIAYVTIAPDLPQEEADRRVQQFLSLPLDVREPSAWFWESFSARTQAKAVAGLVQELVRPATVRERAKPVTREHPLIVTTVDAEEAFDWDKPLSRSCRDVSSMNEQAVMHRVFERFGVVPVYFVTYPVVTEPDGHGFLAESFKAGCCQIGAQLHSWVTPPFDEAVNAFNSFAGNLPQALEYAKLSNLTEAIAARFGARPEAYRAGRYGVGPNTVKTLAALGYRIDSSVVPEFSYHATGGPTFFGRPTKPYWLDGEHRVLELPLTSAYIGRLAREAWRPDALYRDDARHTLSRSVLARTGMMERIRLTPEGTDVSDAKRLVKALLDRGTRIFTLSYHTPSLVPGNTPYVRSLADRDRFIGWFEEFYDFFLGEVGGAPATVDDVYRQAQNSCRDMVPALP